MAKKNGGSRRGLLVAGLIMLVLALPAAAQQGEAFYEDFQPESSEQPPTPTEPVLEDAAEPPVPAERAEPPTPPVLVKEEVLEKPTPYPEPTPSPVPEESTPEPTPEPAVDVVGKSKETVARKFERLTRDIEAKAKAALDRIKSSSQSDAKKLAAAVVGVWGVSAGVGWIAQNANSNKKITLVNH